MESRPRFKYECKNCSGTISSEILTSMKWKHCQLSLEWSEVNINTECLTKQTGYIPKFIKL